MSSQRALPDPNQPRQSYANFPSKESFDEKCGPLLEINRIRNEFGRYSIVNFQSPIAIMSLDNDLQTLQDSSRDYAVMIDGSELNWRMWNSFKHSKIHPLIRPMLASIQQQYHQMIQNYKLWDNLPDFIYLNILVKTHLTYFQG